MSKFQPLDPSQIGLMPQGGFDRLSGLEFFDRHLAGELPSPPMCRAIPMRILHVERGHVQMEAGAGDDHLNPMGGVHGGFAMTVLDSCLSGAVHSTLRADQGYATIEMKINLVRPVPAGQERIIAIANSIHTGRSLATAEGRITTEDERLLAFATCTCAVFNV